ncbi:MAG TPA: alpha/beta fold hydrolase [Candidatus Baltobacteraceae bacterium]|nr:alpha/beta fold hydrolase [Candidatus Baltobacteraceae bacterium]
MSRLTRVSLIFSTVAILLLATMPSRAQQTEAQREQRVFAALKTTEGDYVARDFHFQSGEKMAELRLHYTTLGTPARDASGRTTNAVLIMHGTGGSGHSLLQPIFAGVLFGPGELLDANRYFIILPDDIGHGKSSKPSDGMRAHFPHYDYDDMVAAEHELVEKGLGVNHLRLVMGTSMGCMHTFVWGETYPDFMDALMPLACQAVAVAGRNRVWRKMAIDGIENDPEWKGGDYTTEPRAGIEIATDMLLIAGSAPLQLQKSYPTRDAADKYLADYRARTVPALDANDFLYAVSASRNYDPSSQLAKIRAPVMWINSADDFINPPELGIAEQQVKLLKNGKFVLIPASLETYGHGTHTHAAVWQRYMKELLDESQHGR